MSKNVLTLDIGSSSVEGSLVSREGGKTKVLFSAKEPIPAHAEIDAEKLLYLSARSLDSLLKNIFDLRADPPAKILCLISSPWYVSFIKSIGMEKEKPFAFTKKIADHLLSEEIRLLKGNDSEMEPIELKTLKISLNGYDTPFPERQKAKTLTMEIFVSSVPKGALRKFEDTIKRHFGGALIKFSSSAFAAFSAGRDMFPGEDFLLVDLGGEVTDVISVKKGSFSGIASFPIGTNSLERRISRSDLFLYLAGHAEKVAEGKIRPIVEGFAAEWLDCFSDSLEGVSGGLSVPGSVFLVAEEGFASLFEKAVGSETKNQYDWTESKFKVRALKKEMLRNLYLERVF